MPAYRYRGARAAVILHEEELRRFLAVWVRAKDAGVELPAVDDPDYASLDALAGHVLRWAGTYLKWICAKLDLPDPGLDPVPETAKMAAGAAGYADHLLLAWDSPLRDVAARRFIEESYEAPWGPAYCIDAMLDHAVTHPAKHRLQLEELMGRPDPT